MIATTMQTTSTEPVVTPMMRPLTLPAENKQFLYISTYMYLYCCYCLRIRTQEIM